MTQKIAIVAGGTAGIGRAVVEMLLDDGWKVGVVARGKQRLAELASEKGDAVHTVSANVANARELTDAGSEIVEALGTPRVWINCAMLTSFSPFQDMEVEEFDAIGETTYIGQVNGTRTALRLMKDEGRIVNIGSGLSYRSVPFQSAYCGAKHAINGFTSSVRSELIRNKSKITLSLVQLPAINTPQFEWARNRLEDMPQPAPPIFAPDVAARAVMRAIEDGPRELLVGNSVLKLIFGNMVLPGWLDRKLADDGAEMQKSERDEPGGREDNLHSPASREGTAEGRFSDRAKDKGLIVDGDTARKVVFGALAGIPFLLGLLLG